MDHSRRLLSNILLVVYERVLASYVTDTNAYTYTKASWQKVITSDYSNAETYSKAQPNPLATRLVVPGVAISFGVQRQTLGAEFF